VEQCGAITKVRRLEGYEVMRFEGYRVTGVTIAKKICGGCDEY
jgi:hypothetical protein